MALTQELLKVLDNEEEPLPKRLKIADNAFKSIELPIQRRQAVLLEWLGQTTNAHKTETWDLLLSWLTSQQMQDLSRSDISLEDVKNLMNLITEHTKHHHDLNLSTVISCVTALIENRNFQLLFKYDLKGYCVFISSILYVIENEQQLQNFIRNEQLFNRNLVAHDEFHESFIQNSLACLGDITEKFNNKNTFQEIAKLVERCLFRRNFKNFWVFFKCLFHEEMDSNEMPAQLPLLPTLLLTNLRKFYKADKESAYKLVFHSYCASYNNNFAMIYKFFILIVETLGFDIVTYFKLDKRALFKKKTGHLEKSIKILTGLCQVLTETTNELNLKVNDITFSQFIQDLTISVINLTNQPNEYVYEFLNCVIMLDPLIAEKNIKDILVYIMLSDKESTRAQYEKLLIVILEVFTKLRRIPDLISKVILTLKAALEGDFEAAPNTLNFSGATCKKIQKSSTNFVSVDVLPVGVLNYFTRCITTLGSLQDMKLFNILLYHLEAVVKKDLRSSVEAKAFYIEIISTLMCQFLSSVRIAEHTVPTAIVEKFVKGMDELKEVLGKFGTTLVKMEHNPTLMRAYLNMCYTWGELYTTLAYYSINNEVVLQKTLDSDSSACNITYLHPYLTRDQWCLISQRITNFGEKPCKQIMHKLFLQKLRAMMLFEETVGEEIISSVRTTILSSVDENWKDVIIDQLMLDQIISKASSLRHIAEIILQDLIETNNLQELNRFFDSKELIGAMIYTCLYKLNKAFKRKQKKVQAPLRISLSSKVFPNITEDMFIAQQQNEGTLQHLTEVFVKELALDVKNTRSEVISVVNEKDLSSYMDVIKAIPVVQYRSDIQQVLIVYLTCVLLDLQCSNLQDTELINKCEGIIIGLSQNYKGSFKFLIKPFLTTQIIIDKFPRYLEIFTIVVQKTFRNESDLEDFKAGIKFLMKNIEQEKYLQCATVILSNIHKYKSKYSVSTEHKNLITEYQEEICKKIVKLVKKQSVPDVVHLTEAFTLTLNYNLSKKSNEGFEELLPFVNGYIEGIMNATSQSSQHIKGAVLLLTTVLQNKSKLKTVPQDIVMKAWNYCQNLNIGDKEQEEYSKLVMLIFEHIPNEQFSKVADDLLKLTMQTLNNNNVTKFTDQLKIWNAILSCKFNAIKTKMWQKVLEMLLLETVLVYLRNDKDKQKGCENIYEDVVKFEMNIIRNVHLLLSAPLIESILATVSLLISKPSEDFANTFALCFSLMESLLKFREPILVDYLPSYLQRYRALLNKLCSKSDSDLKLEAHEIQQISDCAHKLEKLTRRLVDYDRHLMRICPYLIAEILKQYEEITLFPNVKIHLNNCLYSLISLCDQHAIAYLMRILSTASTEMFKVMYENYRKYYKYTGKV